MNLNAKNRIKRAKRHADKLLRRIERAHAAGQIERARRLTDLYLHSWGAKVVAADEVGYPLELAAWLDPWRDAAVPTRAWTKRKSNGTTREIAAFGPRDRANQLLVRAVLGPQADILPTQFAVKNGGRENAAGAVKDALHIGNLWAAKLDIRGCYDSYSHDGVKSLLPLPGRVTENVVLKSQETWDRVNRGAGEGGNSTNQRAMFRQRGRQRNARRRLYQRPCGRRDNQISCRDASPVHGGITGSPKRATAPRGIWQGSAVSPLVSEMMIAWALRAAPQGACVTAYSDDIITVANDRGEACATALTLRDVFACHPAGPVILKTDEPCPTAIGFDFIGYNFRTVDGAVRIRANRKNRGRLEGRLGRRRDVLMDRVMMYQAPDIPKIDRMLASAHGWAEGFRSWPFARPFAERIVRELFGLPSGSGDLRARLIDHLTCPAQRAA